MDGRSVANQLLPRLFEDAHYLVVEKPSGLAVHTSQRERPGGVVEALEALGLGAGLRACYKLDKYTSGVLVVAKTAVAAERFVELMKGGRVRLTYAAVVRGRPKAASRGGRTGRPGPKRGVGRRGGDAREPAGVEVYRQFERRSLVRVAARESGGARVRASLRAAGAAVLGDARFDPRPGREQAGRFYVHLETMSFRHPFTDGAMRVKSAIPVSFERAARGDRVLEAHLDVALAARMPCLLDAETDAFRLFNGKREGVSGLLAEKLGDVVVLHAQQGKFQGGDEALAAAAKWYGRRLDLRAVYAKHIPRNRSRGPQAGGDQGPTRKGDRGAGSASAIDRQPIWGAASDAEVVIREHGMRYVVRPNDGYAVGLFLDHRENRAYLRRSAEGRRVLNLFSYTCGFSVAAAVGGAAATASVDLSKKFLAWGKRNFEVNGLTAAEHRFYCCDAFDYFKRAQRQGHRYDVIVLDPPTFSRTKKPARVFQVTRDMARLIGGALGLLERGGLMLVSTNHAELTVRWLRDQIEAGARGRGFRAVESPPAAFDFAGARDAAKSVWVRFD
ncbi:MAG: class I SAM-dependent methyltransferase [Phycisphaerae bacterium]